MRIVLDKIASCTRNARLNRQVVLTRHVPAESGIVLAVRVLDEKRTYNQLEDPHGRLMTVHRGDVIAGVLGNRKALRGYTGDVPARIEVGDTLHLLNLGGVIGRCTSASPLVGPPARVEVLGAVLSFPEFGSRVGVPASIQSGAIPAANQLDPGLPPILFLAGSCMHAGKTAAACALVRAAVERGQRVGVAKLTGVALRRDTLEMLDHGASHAVTFADAGLPSTCDCNPVSVALGVLNELGKRPVDLIVAELGDGLLGDYGVRELLMESQLRTASSGLILAATDPVAAWGAVMLTQQMGWSPTVVTGPATDNAAGAKALAPLGVPAANARTEANKLADIVLGPVARQLRLAAP